MTTITESDVEEAGLAWLARRGGYTGNVLQCSCKVRSNGFSA